MNNREIAWRIFKRCSWEFLPPVVVGLVWLAINWESSQGWTARVGYFSGGFFAFGVAWWNFLRIQYQQTSRAQQGETATEVAKLRDNVESAEGLLRRLTNIVEDIRTSITPQQAKEITEIVEQANTAIQSANTTLRSTDYVVIPGPIVRSRHTTQPSE